MQTALDLISRARVAMLTKNTYALKITGNPANTMNNTALPAETTTSPISTPKTVGGIKRFVILTLRWLLFIPIGLVVTFILTTIVYWIAAFIDSLLPEELAGIMVTRASFVVVLPLISAITVGAAQIAPMHKTGAIIYGLALAGLRVFNIVYVGESVIFAIIYYAPVVFGVYSVLKDKD